MNRSKKEIQQSLKAAREMVHALCQPRGTKGGRRWVMSIPARRDYDPDLVISKALGDAYGMIERIEELEKTCADLEAVAIKHQAENHQAQARVKELEQTQKSAELKKGKTMTTLSDTEMLEHAKDLGGKLVTQIGRANARIEELEGLLWHIANDAREATASASSFHEAINWLQGIQRRAENAVAGFDKTPTDD